MGKRAKPGCGKVLAARRFARHEILGLTWREVDLEGGVIRLDPERSKTKLSRVLPLAPPLRDVLTRRLTLRRFDTTYVFHWEGAPIGDWRKRWHRACRLAGLPGKHLHDCRRTAARNLIRAGVPERVAMALTGHNAITGATRSVFGKEHQLAIGGSDGRLAGLPGLPPDTSGPVSRNASRWR